MQTHFSPEQLNDVRLREAESILRRCVHCGMCNPVCPTYVLGGDERDGPRGRIYLIKGMLENEALGANSISAQAYAQAIQPHIDRCLTCLACAAVCPSGVDYGSLMDLARSHIEARTKRTFAQRVSRALIGSVIPNPVRFRRALLVARLARPFRGLLRAFKLNELAAMLDQASASPRRPGSAARPALPAVAKKRARAVLLWGCAQPVLRPEIHEATIRLLASQGFETVLPDNEGCCGALDLHMGREAEARDAARRNIDAWERELAEGELKAIIIDAAGCGAMVKNYGKLLADDPAYAARARTVSALAKDVSEFLASHDMSAPDGWSDIRVAYHSACALQHGQHIHDEPIRLLRQAGFTVLEVPEGQMCCGSAGSYSLLQSGVAGRLRARKLANLASVGADCVAAGNIGCIQHLAGPGGLPIVHTVQLLDWAHGGPCPQSLRHLEGRMRHIREFLPPRNIEASPGGASDKGKDKGGGATKARKRKGKPAGARTAAE